MRRFLTFFTICTALVALLSMGCLDYTEWLTVEKDGSGTIRFRFAMDQEARKQAEDMANQMAAAFGDANPAEQSELPFADLDEKTIKAHLKERNSKAKLTYFKKSVKGGDEITELEMKFTGPADFDDIAYAIDPDEDSGNEVPFKFAKGSDGLWHFSRTLDEEGSSFSMSDADTDGMDGAPGMAGMPGGDQAPPGAPDMSALFGGINPADMANMSEKDREKAVSEMMENLQKNMGDLQKNLENMQNNMGDIEAQMNDSMKGRKIRFEVTFPGKIVDSNATSVKGKTAVWEYPLTEMKDGNMPDSFTATIE